MVVSEGGFFGIGIGLLRDADTCIDIIDFHLTSPDELSLIL